MNENAKTDWHLDAVIYQRHVKAFRDSNRDGFGDFQGGTFVPLAPQNRRVLVFLRRHEDDVILCVNNLARHAQYVELVARSSTAGPQWSCGAGRHSRRSR